jgi:hemolysin activation/secretion protein
MNRRHAHPARWLACLLLACCAGAAIAQVRTEQDPAQRLQNEQRERQREQDMRQAPPQIALPEAAAAPPADTAIDSVIEDGPLFQIDRILLLGDQGLIRRAGLHEIVAQFSGKRLGGHRISLLLRRLSAALVSSGYVTSRAYLGEQNLASGELRVTIVAGRIEAITFNGAELAPKRIGGGPYDGGLVSDAGTLWAFPTGVGDILSLTDLEQGVDQINRLRRNRAEMQILPGQAAGASLIALRNMPGDRLQFEMGGDNLGGKSTGVGRTRLGINSDNLLGLQESLSAGFVSSLDSNALLASAALPFGYNTWSWTTSAGEYLNLIGESALLYGRTVSHTLGWNRVVQRSRLAHTALDFSISRRKAERDINNILLTPQRLSVLRLAANRLQRYPAGGGEGIWTAELGLSRGLRMFGASVDQEGLASSNAHSQFTKLDISASLTRPLPDLGGGKWIYRGALSGQWARAGLFGSEQIYAGGSGSVRGFREAGISGDRGFVLRNEAIWSTACACGSLRLEPYLFIDAARTALLSQGRWETLAGAGMGLRWAWQWRGNTFTGELLLGHALKQPDPGGPPGVATLSLNWTI